MDAGHMKFTEMPGRDQARSSCWLDGSAYRVDHAEKSSSCAMRVQYLQ